MCSNFVFFQDWLRNNWNNLIDIVSFSDYNKLKQKYISEVGNDDYISTLNETDGVYSCEYNFILLIVEKWLYRQASKHEPELKMLLRNHIEGRTALINRFLFNKTKNLYCDYDMKRGLSLEISDIYSQFYSFWCNFSENRQLALQLLKEKENNNSQDFVIFMGLRKLGLYKEANVVGLRIGFVLDDYYPKVSTNTCALLNYCSPEESLHLIKEAGFDTFDYSMDYLNEFFTSEKYLSNALELRKYADKNGLICNQTHSLFPVWYKSFDKDEIDRRITYTKHILEISKILGAKNCVVHPINDFSEEKNYAFYKNFLDLAKKLDINIATENMFNCDEKGMPTLAACSNKDNYKKLLDLVNNKNFVACVDIGHAELKGVKTSAVDMIENLGNYVKCLHIHDNDLVYDRHGLPLSENIDFDLILDALVRIDYRGDITFECDGFLNRMPKELHLSCLKLMHKIGLYLQSELLLRRKAICIK